MEDYGGSGSKGKKGKKGKKEAKPAQEIVLTESDEKYPTDLPPGTKEVNFDWINTIGMIREVIRQGNRRTCWTIASTRSLSARLIAEGRFNPPLCLSALHLLVGLIDHVDTKGGLKKLEYLQKFMVEHGTLLEDECTCPELALNYKNDKSKPNPVLCTEKCKSKHACVFKIENLVIIKDDEIDERRLMRMVRKGPVAVCIDVYDDGFMEFKGDGIYQGPNKKNDDVVDQHLFLVSGYGTKMPEGIHFWKVQNSAGTEWGHKGFGKIIRQISRPKGQKSLFTGILDLTLLDHYEGEKVRKR